ncbi:hypothetical protein H5410_029774 [Solanum commersonii]|uniref:SWIM-type domain-containing protein n=1 Tax=Solanum commersonii TaxID=4109 RepID=A0A9J5YGP0_SOLCO|nr:hypothetical protein H5410_029774 [Solanum commersonii]
MASLAILVMHSGRWDNDNCYVDYTIEGVIFKESSSYKKLYNVIAMQLDVDTNVIKLKIEYKVKKSKTPMLIHNDMGVRVYIMLKKAADDFNKYPICISKMDNSSNITELCESSNQENDMVTSISNNGIADFETMQLSIGELLEPLCVLGSGSCDGVISDPCNKYVEIDHVYKNKATLKSVMENYAIKNKFQYRTVRSNAISVFTKHATSKLIGGIVKPKLVDHKRKYTPSDIRSDVKIYLGVDVNYSLAWRAKENALISLRGTTATSYSKLPAYLYMMNITYPGSHIRLKKTKKNESFVVYLKNKTCSCGKFQYEEIPCEHAWAVLKQKSLTVLKIYEIPIYPLPDVAEWVIPKYIMYDKVRPPKFKRPPGRPKNKPRSKTKRELIGLKGKHTCSTCGVACHNRRSCRNRPQEV